ncbi:hypothetical protein [Fervidobacterium islandicum]|uniref:hypothetical protein n=1 Tax=Fervidobacterium islandicum TaxID=2423 RepID=UPI003A657493
MDLTLSGLIASMVVLVFIIAMLGLMINLTLNVLNENQEYTSFYAEVQSVTSVLDIILTQSIWNEDWIGTDNKSGIDSNGKFVYLKFFQPQGTSIVTASKKLEFNKVEKEGKFEGFDIVFDGKTLLRTSERIVDIKIDIQTKTPTGEITNPKFLQITFTHKNHKDSSTSRKWKYTVPLLTALSAAL